MGRLTQWSYDHPDAIIMAFGMVGCGALGAAASGWFGGSVGAMFGGLMTFAAMSVEPHSGALGPHQ